MIRKAVLLAVMTACTVGCGVQPTAPSGKIGPEVSTFPPDTPRGTEPTAAGAAEACPRTTAGAPSFVPPAPHPPVSPFEEQFWFGSEVLWTSLPRDGIWTGLPYDQAGRTQKTWWWSEGYSVSIEPRPALTVSTQRMDAPAPAANTSAATNAYAVDIGQAMLVGIEFPTAGCWGITGEYKGSIVSFVVWVAP